MSTDIVMYFRVTRGHIIQVAARATTWRRPRERAIKWDAVAGYATPDLARRLDAMPSIVASITEAQLLDLVTATVQDDMIGRTTWSPPEPGYHDHGREDDWSGDRD